MIYKLRRRFILICTVSILFVIGLVFSVIVALNVSSLNNNMDLLADKVSEGRGRFPNSFIEGEKPEMIPPTKEPSFEFFNPETPFSTRHFTVFFNLNGEVTDLFTESIYAITDEMAVDYAERVLNGTNERGWLSSYRYKVFSTESGKGVVFVDGSMQRSAMMQSMVISGVVLFACATLVLVLILLLSKRAVKPIAESYNKQKRFITDAGHELKTPLTLILANLDIAEGELGRNEWLEDIRFEGNRMTELVNQLVALSRMDEEDHAIELSSVRLGRMVADVVSEFEPLGTARGKKISDDIDTEITCRADEELLRKLVGILMDNAVKYCDHGGDISVTLHSRGKHIVLSVENTYASVGELELESLFDRFYRADKARTFKGGYGVGLSMARSIVEKHAGEITAYKKDSSRIGFKVTLRQ